MALPVEFENINKKEGKAKLSNLIKCYPYHPLRIDIRNINWIGTHQTAMQFPFYGIIEQCHKKGFPLFSDWFERIGQPINFHYNDILTIRNRIVNSFFSLIDNIGYRKEPKRLLANNDFKELNCWITTMYSKISAKDDKNGWREEWVKQNQRREQLSKAHKIFRKTHKHKWERTIQKYKEIQKSRIQEKFKGKVLPINQPIPHFALRSNIGSEKYYRRISKLNHKLKDSKIKFYELQIQVSFLKIFNTYDTDSNNILTSQEFDYLFTEIFRLIGKGYISVVNGKLKIVGNSIEELEEKRVYKDLEKYPKTIKNLDKAYEHLILEEWDDVALYCCKTIENFYKNLLGNKNKYKKLAIANLTSEVRNKKGKIFKRSDSAIMEGIDKLLLSGINLVGTLRNTRDSGHGNVREVNAWEADMAYSYTITLLRTVIKIKK